MIHHLHGALSREPAPHPGGLTVGLGLDQLPVQPVLLPPGDLHRAPRHQPDPGLVSAGGTAADREALQCQLNLDQSSACSYFMGKHPWAYGVSLNKLKSYDLHNTKINATPVIKPQIRLYSPNQTDNVTKVG